MKCKVCSRGAQAQAQSEYCELHQKAYDNIQRKFKVWKDASNTEWKEYLNQILRNAFTGTWAKEVAENLLSPEQ